MKPKSPARRHTLSLAAASALGALGLGGLTGCNDRDAAPLTRFVLLDGSTLTTADLKGKVALVNFWATTCTTCVHEMPSMMDTYRQFKDKGLETVAVAMSYDPPAWVLNYAKTRQLPFKVALDNTGEIAKAWGDVQLTPTTYVVDKRGQIVKRYVGEPDFGALHQLLDQLLAQAA